ncbi:hypothetical protein V6N13_059116 [Hibiscus sabdariffa]
MRDQEGGWLFGFHKSIGIVSPLYAELWAILIGLQLVWDKGIPSLRVQSDSKEALNHIQDRSVIRSSISLVRTIANLVRKHWSVHFQWVPSEGNKVADQLTKHTVSLPSTITILDQPPTALIPLLHRDVFGPPYCKPKY